MLYRVLKNCKRNLTSATNVKQNYNNALGYEHLLRHYSMITTSYCPVDGQRLTYRHWRNGTVHMSDAELFNYSELKECIEDGTNNFPSPEPFFEPCLMKPYSRQGKCL